MGLLAVGLLLFFTWIHGKSITMQGSIDAAYQRVRADRAILIEETVNGIKVVKFNDWEKERLQKLDAMRKEERKQMMRFFVSNGYSEMLVALTYPITSLLCFWIYSVFFRQLTPGEIYSILALIGSMDNPLRFFNYASIHVKFSKIYGDTFRQLLAIPRQAPQADDPNLQPGEIRIRDGSFHWENLAVKKIYSTEEDSGSKKQDEIVHVLSDINLSIKSGEFIGVIGKVGSGKSSLLRAMANEILKSEGEVRKRGSIALIPQEAFLINDTVKRNILFGTDFNQKKYKKTIKLSQLKADLAILQAGDATQIGERGINLSGGQKQRISIARAVYSDSKIYLIDDSLSALDAHVGKKIMDGVFCGELDGRTRVMVTHQLKLLPQFDRIIVLEHGKIACYGALEEIQGQASFQELYEDLKKKEEEAEKNKESSDQDKQMIDEEENRNSGNKKARKNQNNYDDSSDSEDEEDQIDLEAEEERIRKGRITEQENKSKGMVTGDAYKYYIQVLGAVNVLIVCFFFLLFIGYSYFLDYFISVWMENRFGLSNVNYYPLIYIGLILVFLIILFLRTWTFGKTFSRGGYVMLKNVLDTLMKRKMSYFDTTPIGQIITRCGDDAFTVDKLLPRAALFVLTPFFMLFGVSILMVTISPLLFVFVIIILKMVWEALKRSSKVSVELERMLKLAVAPVISTISEVTKGSSSLRVYGKLNFLKEIAKERCNVNSATLYHEGLFFQWIATTIDMLTTTLLILSTWFIVLGKIYG